MKQNSKYQSGANSRLVISLATAGSLLSLVLGVSTAQANGFDLGDSANYAVLYEGNGGNSLQFNNSDITGNIGIAANGQMQMNGPGTITGNINVFAANTGQIMNSGVTVTGTTSYNVNSPVNGVQADMNYLNNLSQTLGGEAGTPIALASGQTVNISTGIADTSGNKVFTVSSVNFPNGTLTINGDGTHKVVFNITGSQAFNGNIVLTGGLTSEDVLFNWTDGNYSTLSGGGTLTISTSGLVTTGTFLDANGPIQINHSIFDGQLYGGDTHNESIVSGATIVAPPPPTVPDTASSLGLLGLGAGLLVLATAKFAGKPV